MCNFSEGVYEKGLNAGIQEGILQTQLDNIKRLSSNLDIYIDKAMELLGIEAEDQSFYLNKIQNHLEA